MSDENKTKDLLLSENAELRKKINDLENELAREIALKDSLQESEEKFKRISDTANDAIIIIDHKATIYFWNKTAEEIFGYTNEEAIGKDLTLIIPEKYRDAHKEGFRSFIETGQRRIVAKRLEINAIGKANKEFPVEVSLSAVKIKGKWNSIGIVRDITERKEMEEALRQSRDQLAEKVKDRTIELTKANELLRAEINERRDMQERLLQSEKLAAIGTIAGGISHDLRNPLGIIANSTAYVDEIFEYAEEKIKKQLTIIHNAVERSTRMITDILDLSKTKPPALEKSDINTLVCDALNNCEKPENINVNLQLSKDIPNALVDPYQTQRVFLNLISNAYRAMPEGGSLTINSCCLPGSDENNASSSEKNECLQISFADSGVGICEDNLCKIFQPLFTTNDKGIGLGMAIVKDIIDKHKGKIDIESEVGKGTVFKITFPLTGSGSQVEE